jgi:MFS family permease
MLFAVLWLTYNANGREVGSADTQPAKYLAAGLVLTHTLTLDAVVLEKPGLAERAGFIKDTSGHWRSAYPILPGLVASVPAFLLSFVGLVDLSAPLAPNLIAALTASTLTAAAVMLVFLSLTRMVPTPLAWLTALGLGLGTNYWSAVSQTLGQQDIVAFGFALALWSAWRVESVTRRQLLFAAVGLALAGAARPQVAPIIAVVGLALLVHAGWRRALPPALVVAAAAVAVMATNLLWFGHAFGGTMQIEGVHEAVHGVTGVFAAHPWKNAVDLLVSPSRGLLIFSPIVLLVFVGLSRRLFTRDLRWLAVAALLQFCVYASYSVWWGGHTFGPRYTSDLLVLLAPFGALGVARVAQYRTMSAAAIVLFTWSVGVQTLGAFVYPHERWNSDPLEVDRYHDRLSEWPDSQITRAWRTGTSPQNFSLFSRRSVRRDIP